ncbi:MAG: tRNA dihydrouridine synthase DusB [Gammaproteobacteria bacterium HGW-Gammaproteobacteria-3]|nr:MAG: tRNA dihydrouridine synthase DusB [Gammaproteobacteria bacterium HGW-Gammaproteobacteria-3]
MQIGPFTLTNNLILAPMTGITDRPFRTLCKHFGAGLAWSEMVASKPSLQKHRRTLLKTDQSGEPGIRAVQILGTDPVEMADAARLNVQRGAQIIDINMGCPAKKVCSVAAGSALMKDEDRVKRILEAVVNAVSVPVTLKIRTGWDLQNRNAVNIAKIAEQAGIAALTVHGRTRACKFEGHAEYDTIRQVKQAIRIPVIANGDIKTPEKALDVLQITGADAIMIGRGAQGAPWLFRAVAHYLNDKKNIEKQNIESIQEVVFSHLNALYSFYGAASGVKMARKHIAWYLDHLGALPTVIRQPINQSQTPVEQLNSVKSAFTYLIDNPAT